MKNILILFSLFAVVSCNNSKEKNVKNVDSETTKFYVGTYTGNDSKSEGIYTYQMDGDGMLSMIGLAAEATSPSFLRATKNGKYLVAVNEVNSNNGNGTVESYLIKEDKLEKISTSSSGGAHPCHVSINKSNDIVVANYTSGNVGLLNLDKNGKLSELLDVMNHEGSGPNTERQNEPHAHSAWFRNGGKEVIAIDLGTDDLWLSSVENGKLKPASQQKLSMKPGAGPRHLDFHPNGKFIYVMNELDNTVGLVTIKDDGSLSLGQTYPTLPTDFAEFNKTADIHVSDDGRFVYASNRGHNSIAVFAIDSQTGSLDFVERVSVKGDAPRNFKITPDQKFILVANQNTNNIVSYRRNTETGRLEYINEIEAPKPVCIEFFK